MSDTVRRQTWAEEYLGCDPVTGEPSHQELITVKDLVSAMEAEAEHLEYQLDHALKLIKRFRLRAQAEINDGDVMADVRFNGGNPVLLCHACRVIMRYGVNPHTVKAAICPVGHGCGALLDKKSSE